MMKNLVSLVLAASAGLGIALAAPGEAQPTREQSLSLRDTFPIGTNGLCEAQIVPPEQGAGLFDRRYSVICRDAAAPVGTLWAVRGRFADQAEARFGNGASGCSEQPGGGVPQGLSRIRRLECAGEGSIIRREVLAGEEGNRTFAASGLAAYSKALELGIASLASDRVVAGTVEVPLTLVTDDVAFARQQAEAISADQALVEAYRRSNAGNFAEAAEFFAVSSAALSGPGATEATLNQALQQSNLGNFVEARRLFARTRADSAVNPVLARLQRNFEALDALNRQQPGRALTFLETPLSNEFGDISDLRELRIGPALANRLAAESLSLTSGFSISLTPLERAQLLDGQADYLTATALRQVGRPAEANASLQSANNNLAQVRGGQVPSIIWLRAQILGELAEIAERDGQTPDAERLHLTGIDLLDMAYPGSPAADSARAQLAGFYTRSGRRTEALTLYRDIVSDARGRQSPSLRSLLGPYFALLLDGTRGGLGDAAAAADVFAAGQLLQRPGLAQTQAVLARELSGGNDEASELFRKTTNLSRAIEQTRLAIQQMQLSPSLTAEQAKLLAERQQALEQLQMQQAEILQKLAQYPRYRAASDASISLGELQQSLKADEAYVKLVTLDQDAYVVHVTSSDAGVWKADASATQLERMVNDIRDSIAVVEAGQVLTYPFDVERSRELYMRLFSPVADRLPNYSHIIFEPDGALLKLPINLLVTDDASVQRYQQRIAGAGGDEYDFRGIAWLGRSARISTSVSPSAFRDVRAAKPSAASQSYLGLGENVPITSEQASAARTRSVMATGEDCLWSPSIWANPIKADELFSAAARFGSSTRVLTRADFTDSSIKQMQDLSDYRILHFATHGLVTAPQPQCPPRPALLTSFGDGDSDGLLTFAEIFGLRLDADLVILSACDTAGTATIGATREAGVTGGGDFALDGLVRAFVGAGGRTVLASHWPVPDDFDATKRLVSGLFAGDRIQTAEALRRSQVELMDDANTSHPFYWSAFAVVGDGATQLAR